MERVMLLGNPGTGKSTLLNSLIGRPQFQSGLSFGQGKTTILQEYQAHGVTYVDTPGLEDIKLRQAAAAAITTALRKHGTYKLFFVVILRSGRVQPEDVTTINQVISSVKMPIPYSVIINCVKTPTLNALSSNPHAKRAVLDSLNSGQYSTESIFILPMQRELEEGSNRLMRPCPPGFVAFVAAAPSVYIPPERVQNVATAAYDRQLAELTQKIERLRKENQALEERASQLKGSKYDSEESSSWGKTAAVGAGVAAVVLCSIM